MKQFNIQTALLLRMKNNLLLENEDDETHEYVDNF